MAKGEGGSAQSGPPIVNEDSGVELSRCKEPLGNSHLKEVCNPLSPGMIFLSETKNKKRYMEKVRRILNFEDCFVVEAIDKAGGMALMWKNQRSNPYGFHH